MPRAASLVRVRSVVPPEPADAHECSCQDVMVKIAAIIGPLDSPFPVPDEPPPDWFMPPPGMEPGQKLTVTDEGRVFGYFYSNDVCILDGSRECWMPDPSPSRYAAFHQGEVLTADGEIVRVGVIGNVGGHADLFAPIDVAQRKYADPNCALMVVRAGDDGHGGWVAGALVPGATFRDVALIRRSALSGDWRWFDKPIPPAQQAGYDCLGPTLVNNPGLPLVRAAGRVNRHLVYVGSNLAGPAPLAVPLEHAEALLTALLAARTDGVNVVVNMAPVEPASVTVNSPPLLFPSITMNAPPITVESPTVNVPERQVVVAAAKPLRTVEDFERDDKGLMTRRTITPVTDG